MVACSRLKIYAGAPSLAQRIGGGRHHSGKRLDAFELTQLRLRQNAVDGFPQRIVVDGSAQTANQSGRQLLEGHYLQPVPVMTSCVKPNFAHRKTAMGNYGPALHSFHPVLTVLDQDHPDLPLHRMGRPHMTTPVPLSSD